MVLRIIDLVSFPVRIQTQATQLCLEEGVRRLGINYQEASTMQTERALVGEQAKKSLQSSSLLHGFLSAGSLLQGLALV